MAEALMRGLSAIFRPRLLLIYWLLSVLLALGIVAGYETSLLGATSHIPDPGAFAAEPASPWLDDVARSNGSTMAVLGQGAGAAVWLWMGGASRA